ncbi:hypothetical protein BGX33_010444 [Mortierella sp. NVP41]|nr:hypothetical protein BGX33_010444 [Mortierella sp. NVP41]
MGPQPVARNDSNSTENESVDGSSEEGANEGDDEDEKGNDDTPEHSGNEDEEGDEDDGDEGGSEDEDEPGNSERAISGHAATDNDPSSPSSSSSRIPVASISVAAACLIGICAFLIYLGKKRKRERVRAAWVESVFGTGGSQGGTSSDPYNKSTINSATTGRTLVGVGNIDCAEYHQRNMCDDRSSMVSDTQTDRVMIERRQSTASTVIGVAATPMSAGMGTRRESTMSRAAFNAVMLPAPAVRGSYGTTTNTPTWGGGYSCHRSPEPHNDGYNHDDRYEEFFDHDGCEVDPSELTHLAIDYSPGPTSQSGPGEVLTSPQKATVQRPAVVVYSKNTSNGGGDGELHNFGDDPFQDRGGNAHHPQQQHGQQRHSMHTIGGHGGRGIGKQHRSPTASDYRRPHSFTIGSHRGGAGQIGSEPKTLYYRTHILDESDQESVVDGEMVETVAGEGKNRSSTVGKLSGNMLKDHFKRLSTPYVKAIRDQQQHQGTSPSSLSCIEEGSMPVPGPATASERRWSRALLKGVVGVGGGYRQDSSEEIVVEESAPGGEGDEGSSCHQGHRQVHSGSLASFRGLDDPSHPRLRVMNSDDGAS